LVFYCVNVGIFIRYTSGCEDESPKKSENVIIEAEFLRIKTRKNEEATNEGSKRKQRKKSINKRKGKTVPFINPKKWIRKKQNNLRRRMSRGINCEGSMGYLFMKLLKLLKFSIFLRKAKNVILIFDYLNSFNLLKLSLLYSLYTIKCDLLCNFIKRSKVGGWVNEGICKFKVRFTNLKIKSLTIDNLLKMGTIESNPGPKNMDNRCIDIVTFNCNGLGDIQKRRRIFEKSDKIASKGGIVMLQETHITNEKEAERLIKAQFRLSKFKSNSAGIITIFSNDFKVIQSQSDTEGRMLLTLTQNEDEKFLLVNVYCPNNHIQSVNFIETVFLRIFETLETHPDCYIIMGGDFNSCLTNKDFLNRNKTKPESDLTDLLQQNTTICDLTDTFRFLNDDPGYTWNRGMCYSRLDYIYLSKSLNGRIKCSKINWAFDKSDHAALVTTIVIREEIRKGPGIVKVNPEVLDDPLKREQIRNELIFLLNQIPADWDGHMKLDYLKMILRSTIAKHTNAKRAEEKEELESLELALNDIEALKQKVMAKYTHTTINYNERIGKIDKAKSAIKISIDSLRKVISDRISFRSAAKWFEYGEKSNKFFLNLTKLKSKQKLISSIKHGEKHWEGQDAVMKGIEGFYSDLYRKDPKVGNNQDNDSDFFNLCPKLSTSQKVVLDNKLTLEELRRALFTCKESAPGPDGIPYRVYKVFWQQVGQIISESWDYSVVKGLIPKDHRQAIITMIPKEGKDNSDIKNWRPITLSNCDAKIITKALANRLKPILDSIIDPTQTAYVPGRSVMDNLRSNMFLKDYCKINKIDAILTSLDAQKAFDSVDHAYIDKILDSYGFGDMFRKYFSILYNDLTAKILVNGYFSEAIRIERGVKQGDALSCAIFILCIDPLLRNINKNSKIKLVKVVSKLSKTTVTHKASGFADDISVICLNDVESVDQIFKEYERLSNKSGLILNADKTEILRLHAPDGLGNKLSFEIKYNGSNFMIECVSKLKICGIYYCNNDKDESDLNVAGKIMKLKTQLKKWTARYLTMEGKSLIVKTFGLSQLIYSMQCVRFDNPNLVLIERLIFNFLWSNKEMENNSSRDRIKRSVMKNDYKVGGLRITDVECLDRSLKLRQYIRASKSNHNIAQIQKFCSESSGSLLTLPHEFANVTKDECVSNVAQETINIIMDEQRMDMFGHKGDDIECSISINHIAGVNVQTYLLRKSRPFLSCIFRQLKKEGIDTFLDLAMEAETEMNKPRQKRLESILNAFPKYFRDAAKSFNENINTQAMEITHLLNRNNKWQPIHIISTSEIQWILKKALNRVSVVDFEERLNVPNGFEINIMEFRNSCKNAKLRNIYFRLIHNDFFTHERMFKYKMVNSPYCPRCGMIENIDHLMWECKESKQIWKCYNEVLNDLGLERMILNKREDLYKTEILSPLSLIKMKIIQEIIQIERPKNWSKNNVHNLIKHIRNIEVQNATDKHETISINRKWKHFLNVL
jgi:exonuclease III